LSLQRKSHPTGRDRCTWKWIRLLCLAQRTRQAWSLIRQPGFRFPPFLTFFSFRSEIPPDRPGQVHVEVDTPFVFSAKNAAGVEPYSTARISLSTLPNLFFV